MWTEKLYWKSIISQVLNGWKINGWLGGGYADLVPFDGFGVWVIGVVNGGGGSMLNTCPNPDWPEWSEAGRSSQGCRHQGVCSVSLSFFVRGLHMWILQMHSKTTGGIPPTEKSHMKRHLAVCFPDRCFFSLSHTTDFTAHFCQSSACTGGSVRWLGWQSVFPPWSLHHKMNVSAI